MAYTQHSWMLMDIVVGLSVRPSVRLFVYSIFRWLCICWQITWNKWHKIWHDVVIIGRWLLPSLVDTGDICCHYWQLILVLYPFQCMIFQPGTRSLYYIDLTLLFAFLANGNAAFKWQLLYHLLSLCKGDLMSLLRFFHWLLDIFIVIMKADNKTTLNDENNCYKPISLCFPCLGPRTDHRLSWRKSWILPTSRQPVQLCGDNYLPLQTGTDVITISCLNDCSHFQTLVPLDHTWVWSDLSMNILGRKRGFYIN